jgi:hypothetical protein
MRNEIIRSIACTVAISVLLGSCSSIDGESGGTDSANRAVDSHALQYPDSHDFVWERIKRVGYSGLNPQEKVFHCIWWFEAEINNGGFDQFFGNTSGDLCQDTLDALHQIGAFDTEALLRQAILISFDEAVPSPDQNTRLQQMKYASVAEEDRVLLELLLLDLEFYKYDDSLDALANNWLNATHNQALQRTR